MNPVCEETVSGQLNTVDRFSDLPDFIIHHIISFLDTREAYRTCILSKRWAHISATNPIIEFHFYSEPQFPLRLWPSEEVFARLLGYIDSRMQRYAKDNLRVRTLRLMFPHFHRVVGGNVKDLRCIVKELPHAKELPCKVDEWLRIATRNHVAELDIDGPINYKLPDILLSAKYLKRLVCYNVKIPYYNKATSPASLQTLVLFRVVVEEHMLNHIISSCLLLKCLSVKYCSGFKTIVISCCSQLKELILSDTLPKDGTIILETSSLMCFKFSDLSIGHWPVMSKPGLLTNLTVLDIFCSGITDGELGKLLPELASLETLLLRYCQRLTTIRVSSIRLKVIYLEVCRLVDVMVDAPSLTKFIYGGAFGLDPAITISSQASCDISVRTTPNYLDTQGFFKLQKLMTGLRSCNALEIVLTKYLRQSVCDNIKFNEEELGGDVNLGPPRDIKELKLTLYDLKLSRSSVSAFLNGIFWTCRPDIISLRFHLEDPDLMVQLLTSELEEMANCWRHPLKRVEVPDGNCSNFSSRRMLDS